MRVGIIYTKSSPCRCAQAIAAGLKTLGHETVLMPSEEIERHASELAWRCDLIIDHTDTLHGKGFLRPVVRLMLEARGARLVGSDSKACFLSDDKASAKARLFDADISVPPGIVVNGENWEIPGWLTGPMILKPVSEHMSRGIILAQDKPAAYAAAAELSRRYDQEIMVEQYIPGRELAVSLLDGAEGLRMLPPLEWLAEDGACGVLSEAFKLKDHPRVRPDARQAGLPAAQQEQLESLSLRAFHALGLRDYARFDIRLSPSGTFFFLEANTTPSLEFQEALALSAKWSGMDYPALLAALLTSACRRYGIPPTERFRMDRR